MREAELALPGWPAGLETRIALMADLHVGSPRNGPERLRRLVDRVNELDPDIVVIAGDIVIDNVLAGRFVAPEEIAEALAALETPGGVFAVLGNHDRWLSAERVAGALERIGTEVVENRSERVLIDGHAIRIAGVSDYWTGHPDLPKALSEVETGEPVVLVTHNPDIFPEVPDRVSLTLAGHTHGGQVVLPFVGPAITPSRYGPRYASGLVIEDGRHLFVTTGVGTSRLGVRFLVPPEVVLLTLRSGEAAPGGATSRARPPS